MHGAGNLANALTHCAHCNAPINRNELYWSLTEAQEKIDPKFGDIFAEVIEQSRELAIFCSRDHLLEALSRGLNVKEITK